MNLVSLAQAEAWLGVTSDSGGPIDASVSRLIAAASRSILSFLDRSSLVSRSYNEVRDGTGTGAMILRQWPVTSISSLVLGDLVIPSGIEPASGAGYLTPGFLFEPWDGVAPGKPCKLSLRGYAFCRGSQNTAISYTAGYLVSNEAFTVPNDGVDFAMAVQQPDGAWLADNGVIYAATKIPLVRVPLLAPSTAPARGEYQLSSTIPGGYIFSPLDANQNMLISYSYVPSDIEQACLQGIQTFSSLQSVDPTLRSEKYDGVSYSYNTAIGSMAGVASGNVIISPLITSMLQPYRRVTRAA